MVAGQSVNPRETGKTRWNETDETGARPAILGVPRRRKVRPTTADQGEIDFRGAQIDVNIYGNASNASQYLFRRSASLSPEEERRGW